MPQGNFSDKEILNVMLNQHKQMASSLTNLILESANEQVRNTAMRALEQTFQHQKQIFDMMSQQGWYQVQQASQQDIARVQSQLSGSIMQS